MADERTQLLGWLDLQRELVPYKCEHLADRDAHHSLLSTSPMMTMAGLVSHLRWVEHCWFEVLFLGGPPQDNPQFADLEDADFQVEEMHLARLLDDYARQWARSNEIVAAASLDEVARSDFYGDDEDRPSLRWIVLHVLEETARHVGHMDLLREQLDGRKGYW